MGTKRLLLVMAVLLSLAINLGFASQASAQAASRSTCQNKADKTVQDLDKWIDEYGKQMNAAEPIQKPKYEEWIRELRKLKTLVEKANDKLKNTSKCATAECVADQCNLLDIADQQVAQLIKETEEQLGAASRFGEEGGREVIVDEITLGDDTTLVDNIDPNDASEQSYSDRSDTSSQQTTGQVGSVFDDSSSDSELPPTPPKDVASPF